MPFRGRRKRPPVQVTARNRRGEPLWLPRVRGAVGLRRASGSNRRFWRDILPFFFGNSQPAGKRLDLILLVLEAKRIPHTLHSSSRRASLLVPALYELPARHEIAAFEAERSRRSALQAPMGNPWPAIVGFFLLLAFWHGLRMRWFTFHLPSPLFPAAPADWPAAFGLDVYRTTVDGQWWRSVTALFLHADTEHLISNMGFGLIFFWALNRRIGSGPGFAFADLAGILGNICNALYKPAHVVSLGFSTALFGAVGVAAGIAAYDAVKKGFSQEDFRKLLVPLAAGLAFLGLFGGGGEERTDYAAHIFGFCCGFLLGAPAWLTDNHLRSLMPKRRVFLSASCGVGIGLLVAAAWTWAVVR